MTHGEWEAAVKLRAALWPTSPALGTATVVEWFERLRHLRGDVALASLRALVGTSQWAPGCAEWLREGDALQARQDNDAASARRQAEAAGVPAPEVRAEYARIAWSLVLDGDPKASQATWDAEWRKRREWSAEQVEDAIRRGEARASESKRAMGRVLRAVGCGA